MAGHTAPVVSDSVASTLKERKDRSFGEMLSSLKEKNVDLKAIGRGNFIFQMRPWGYSATFPASKFLSTIAIAMQTSLVKLC